MSNEQAAGASWKAVGTVARKHVVGSGKMAFLTLEIPGHLPGKRQFLDLKTFEGDVVSIIDGIDAGTVVEASGHFSAEKLVAKDRTPIQVDGRDRFISALVVTKVKAQAGVAQPKPALVDDEMPF